MRLKINDQLDALNDSLQFRNRRDIELLSELTYKYWKAIDVQEKVSRAYQQRFLKEKIKEASIPNGVNAFQKTLPVQLKKQKKPGAMSLSKQAKMCEQTVRKFSQVHNYSPNRYPEMKPARSMEEAKPLIKDSGECYTGIPLSWDRDYIVDHINDATVKGLTALGYAQDDILRNVGNIFRKQPLEKTLGQYKNSPFLKNPDTGNDYWDYMCQKEQGKNPSNRYNDFSDLQTFQTYKNTVPNSYLEAVAKGIGESVLKKFSPGNVVVDSIEDKLSLGAAKTTKIDKNILDAVKDVHDVYHDWENSKEE